MTTDDQPNESGQRARAGQPGQSGQPDQSGPAAQPGRSAQPARSGQRNQPNKRTTKRAATSKVAAKKVTAKAPAVKKAAVTPPGRPPAHKRPATVDLTDKPVTGAPEVVYRPTGPAEANSEQELAGHDRPVDADGEFSTHLHEDGDQSVGAVAAFARSVSSRPADEVATSMPSPAEPVPAEPVPEPVASAPVAEPLASAPAPEPVAIASVPEPVAVAAPASAEDVEKAWKDNSLAQVLYHDWEAGTYDEKWSISFDERCITYARDRFSALLGPQILRAEAWPYGKALEIGAGTGFFSLNLRQAGVLSEVHVSDVSSGMVENAQRNARQLGFEVTGAVAFAENLPYEDDTFDIVVGHAVIHHIPDVESALREILRVLRPGGRFVIAGEPTRAGDWYARRLGRLTWELTTRATRLTPLRGWARSQEDLDASSRAAALEAVVDLHTFVPDELRAMAERAGASDVKLQTEELLAAFLGWPVRTFEAAVNPDKLGFGWSNFAFKGWKRLSAVDRVLSKAVPQQLFYNVGITGTKGT